MRSLYMIITLFVLVCLTACMPEEDFDVVLSDSSDNTFFDDYQNKSLENISFTITNKEDFALGCEIFLEVKNSSNFSKKAGRVGVIGPGDSKRASFVFKMFGGESDLKIYPICSPADY